MMGTLRPLLKARFETTMRVLIGVLVGLVIGALSFVQINGWIKWVPEVCDPPFFFLHLPAMLVAQLFFPGESGFWSSMPYFPVQWPILGLIVGLVLHLKHGATNH